jgi:hypothetical protein
MWAETTKMPEGTMHEFLKNNLPDPLSRVDVVRAGCLSYGRLAHLDQAGEGPPSYTVGRTKLYGKTDFIGWYCNRYSR